VRPLNTNPEQTSFSTKMERKMTEKKRSGMFWVMVGCGGLLVLGVPILGILAAIAIPAFLRYTKQSKVVESTGITRMISNAAINHYSERCVFPPSAAPSGAIPTGGTKTTSNFSGKGWDELRLVDSEPKYFAYYTENEANVFRIFAVADFSEGGEQHTLQVDLIGDPKTCEATVKGDFVINEFE
jgi:type II secretory pathway pseudopilin PulG